MIYVKVKRIHVTLTDTARTVVKLKSNQRIYMLYESVTLLSTTLLRITTSDFRILLMILTTLFLDSFTINYIVQAHLGSFSLFVAFVTTHASFVSTHHAKRSSKGMSVSTQH